MAQLENIMDKQSFLGNNPQLAERLTKEQKKLGRRSSARTGSRLATGGCDDR